MLAAQYDTAGARAGELEIVDLPDPSPAAGEVLVRIAVSGVNPTDWKSRHAGGVTAVGFERVVPGQDGAGEIVAVGDGVDRARVGQRVWIWLAQWRRAHGTAAQLVALPSANAPELPDGVSFELGAGLGVPAITAHRCLFGSVPVAGTAVLVRGGAGAVGHAAIELARWGGARVAATVSSDEKAELASAAGAELVVDYRREDVAAAVGAWSPDGIARIVEVDLAANLDTDAAVLSEGGVVSTYAVTDRPVTVPRRLMALNAALEFVLLYTVPDTAKRRAVDDITAALRANALTSLPGLCFGLGDIAAAHDAVRTGAVGKVLVDIPA